MRSYSEGNSKKRSNKKIQPINTSIDPAGLPFRPSWVNRLIGWINRLPIAPWLFYSFLVTLLTLALFVSNWLDGSKPFGRFDAPFWFTYIGFYPVVFLAAIHHVDGVANRSFDAFQPALGKSEIESARLRYELTTLPARGARIAALIGAAGIPIIVFLGGYQEIARSIPLTFGIALFIGILGFIMTAEMLYHTFRQLRLVNYLHTIATELNLLQPAPLYAFSHLSARTGLIFLFVLWFDLVFNPETFTNLGLVLLNVLGLGFFAIACFVVPLWGMHRRLVREKRNLQSQTNQKIEESFKLLYQRLDSQELHDADPLNKSINSLITAHDFISKIPTWPWRPETFTFFFSAVTFPIIVFIIQTLLKNYLNL